MSSGEARPEHQETFFLKSYLCNRIVQINVEVILCGLMGRTVLCLSVNIGRCLRNADSTRHGDESVGGLSTQNEYQRHAHQPISALGNHAGTYAQVVTVWE